MPSPGFIIIAVVVLTIVFVVVMNSLQKKYEEEKRLEELYNKYAAKAQQTIESFPSEHRERLVDRYGEEYLDYHIDISYRVIVNSIGVRVIFYLEAEGDTLDNYASLHQKEYFCGFGALLKNIDYSDYVSDSVTVEVYVNGECYTKLADVDKELEEVAENRKTCKHYNCYARKGLSGYCEVHEDWHVDP